MPRTLTLLYASGNRLSALPALPPELTILEASDNVLTELPALPQTWLSVVVANNRLTDLPSLPSELRWLNVHGNRLPVQFSERNCLAQARRWQQGNLPPAGSDASPPAPADDTGAASAHAAAPETRPNPSPSPSDEVAGAATRRSPVPDSRPSSGRVVRLPPLASRFIPPQLPRRDEYQASAASTARAGAGHVATSRGANVRGALRSEYLPASAVFASWRFSGDNAADFNRFLARLGETSDFVNPSLQPRMIARIDRVIAGMRSAPALRDICFGIATQAIESCSDRITQGIGDMERAKINHDVEVQDHTIAELLAIGRGLFKLKVLDDIADAEIAAQRASGEPMDDLEIRLAYQIGLRDRLELPAVADSMSYRTTANLEPEMLTNAEATVRRGLSNSASVNFLADWAPWRRALQHADADGSYERTRVSHQLERDALSIQPAQITEGEWMEELAEMQERQAGDVFRITRRLTRDVLAQEGAV